jgi:hypothetical protein
VKLFKLVSTNGDIEWVITNDLSVGMNAFVIELKNENRWQVEEFYMGFKQLRGSEKCQCRKAAAQRNHLSCCYLAWVNLKLQALKIGKTKSIRLGKIPLLYYLKIYYKIFHFLCFRKQQCVSPKIMVIFHIVKLVEVKFCQLFSVKLLHL